MTVWEELRARGLFFQCTHEEKVKQLLENEKTSIYIGFDPTGESLHLGHFIPFLTLCHLGRYGHTPIILIGGGTARVGDPSGKTESRPLLTDEQLQHNITNIETQVRRILAQFDIEPVFVNNAEWLNDLHYIDFIRDIGRHFSVSRMLSFDTYKNRLEDGLSFLEFNYQLLQAYDYLHLHQQHNCTIQMGGADQWANIVAGCDLIRRVDRSEVYGYTLPLVTRSDGSKMGKTERGAIFIDEKLTTPYEMYQYLRNTPDADVIQFLKYYTFISIEEIKTYEKLEGAALNKAKEILAYSVTALIHGEAKAEEAEEAAKAVFYGNGTKDTGSHDTRPSFTLEKHAFPISILDIYVQSGLCTSKGEARRLVEQGGAKLNGEKISSIEHTLEKKDCTEKDMILSAGKKKHIRLVLGIS